MHLVVFKAWSGVMHLVVFKAWSGVDLTQEIWHLVKVSHLVRVRSRTART